MDKLNLTDQVMQTIEQKDVRIRPKAYFLVGTVILGLGITLLFLIATIFTNFAAQHLRSIGPLGYLWFGEFGLRAFIETFPWIPLGIAFGAIICGLIFIRKYEFSYKHNFLAVAGAIIVGILSGGFVLDQIGLNEQIHHVPAARPFMREQFHGELWIVGEIIEVTPSAQTLIVRTPEGTRIPVIWDQRTLLPFGGYFELYERVRIVGEQRGDYFYAVGIGKGGLKWRKLSFIPYQKVYITPLFTFQKYHYILRTPV